MEALPRSPRSRRSKCSSSRLGLRAYLRAALEYRYDRTGISRFSLVHVVDASVVRIVGPQLEGQSATDGMVPCGCEFKGSPWSTDIGYVFEAKSCGVAI